MPKVHCCVSPASSSHKLIHVNTTRYLRYLRYLSLYFKHFQPQRPVAHFHRHEKKGLPRQLSGTPAVAYSGGEEPSWGGLMAFELRNRWREYGNIMGISWEYHGNIMGISWEYHGNIMGISWEYHGNIMGISWEYHGNIMGISWEYQEKNLCVKRKVLKSHCLYSVAKPFSFAFSCSLEMPRMIAFSLWQLTYVHIYIYIHTHTYFQNRIEYWKSVYVSLWSPAEGRHSPKNSAGTQIRTSNCPALQGPEPKPQERWREPNPFSA